MKKSIPEYINVLSEDNYEIFEEIFINKYRKFMYLYWLITDFDEYIDTLKYKTTKKDKLKIVMYLKDIDTDYVLSRLQDKSSNDENVLIYIEDDKIKIEIIKEEDDESIAN